MFLLMMVGGGEAVPMAKMNPIHVNAPAFEIPHVMLSVVAKPHRDIETRWWCCYICIAILRECGFGCVCGYALGLLLSAA